MKELIGQQLGPYKILDLLGEGQAGYTFRAVLGPQIVAIKVLKPELTLGEGFRAEFTSHAQALTSPALKHPNITETYHFGFGDQSGVPYVVTELVPGGAVGADKFQKPGADRNIEFLESVNLIKQVAEALAVVHGEKLVHGNIKPTNILLGQMGPAADPSAKLSDVGLARLVTEVRRPERVVNDSPYISPEQRRGTWSDTRSDIYSLGAVLYELTTRRPFQQAQTTVPGTSQSAQIVPPSQWLLQFPKELENIILRCLKTRSADRFRSATELADSLNEFLKNNGWEGRRRTRTAVEPDTPPDEPAPIQAAAPTVQIFYGRNTLIETHAIGSAGVTIGSAAGNSIVLSGAEGVSPNHVTIEWDGHEVTVTDLGSKTGTRLKRQELHPQFRATWEPKEWLRVGSYWIWLHPPGTIGPLDKVEVIVDETGKFMTLTPGVSATCQVTIVNQQSRVDHFHLSVAGIPPSWVVDGTLKDVELKASGGKKVIPLVVKVPKDSSARAGDYHVQIVATSKAQSAVDQAFAKATWTVLPFDSVSMTVTPPKVSGRKVARFTVNLRQDGTGDPEYTLSAAGDDDEKQFEFAFATKRDIEEPQARVQLKPASTKTLKLKLTAPRKWIGAAEKCGITVNAQANDGTVLTKEVRFFHRAVFPPWFLAVVPVVLLAVGFVVFYVMKPQDPDVWTVPPQEQLVQGEPFILRWNGKTANRIIVRVDGQDLPNAGIRDEYRHPGTTEKSINVMVQGENFFGKSNPRNTTFRLRPPPGKPAAVIQSFTANPSNVIKGQYVTLRWSILNATSAKVDPGIGTVNPKEGSVPTAPLEMTQQFKLTAYVDNEQSAESTVTVTVSEPLPEIVEFSARDPKRNRLGPVLEVDQGDEVEFSWKTRNARNVQIQAISTVPLSTSDGMRLAEFTGRGLYTLTLVVTSADGVASQTSPSVQVKVNCGGLKKIPNPFVKCSDKQGIKWKG